ncbi:hypothetical protein CBS101457_001243 [Exobasidium rhododendri]|nr:hypothetical protein CBS101457_001243 [Exobasidium rhododendri]
MRGSHKLLRVLLASSVFFITALNWFTVAAAGDDEVNYEQGKPLDDPSLIWGTYRPQIYFGIRSALPESFLSGLIWFSPQRFDTFLQARHDCNEGDKIEGYGYKYHDGRSFAVQEIKDVENNYMIETSWLKTGHEASERSKGSSGSWAARIKGSVIDADRPAVLSPIWYFSQESEHGSFEPLFEDQDYPEGLPSSPDASDSDDIKAGRFFAGTKPSEALTSFNVRFKDTPGAENKPVTPYVAREEHEDEFAASRPNWHYFAARIPSALIWRGKDVVLSDISTSVKKAVEEYGQENLPPFADLLTLPDEVRSSPNFVALQRSFQGNFSIDVYYDSDDTPKGSLLDGQGLTMALEASKRAYEKRFEQIMPVEKLKSERMIEYARDLTSQIVGSIGYYFGQSIVDRSFNFEYDEAMGGGVTDANSGDREPDPQLTEEQQLLTGTPSRSKFPRGFYWDEGFHLAHIGVWDNDLSLEILKSWIDLVDEDGWVAREQILGEEARSKVPSEFQTQYPLYANPPTLAMTVTSFIDRLEAIHGSIFPLEASFDTSQTTFKNDGATSSRYLEDPLLARSFLTGIYPKLRRHYLWLRRTQRGQIREWDRVARARGEGFRWRGRTKDHVLTSGLDDYPRAVAPHVGELHIDLLSWMGAFAEAMTKLARAIGEDDDAEEYGRSHRGIIQNIDDLHWNEEEQMFCDASIDENEESFHVCHRGYISLFPFLLGLLPSDSPHLEKLLDILRDPNHLWSDYGIRSLSKTHPLYGKGENYWRGPIWIPINYLALKALKTKYAAESGPQQVRAAQIYQELRDNIIKNTFAEYQQTGFTWEQYDPETGKGQRSHPFTGWTSTVALIMAEIY